jgi:hypothetical protein
MVRGDAENSRLKSVEKHEHLWPLLGGAADSNQSVFPSHRILIAYRYLHNIREPAQMALHLGDGLGSFDCNRHSADTRPVRALECHSCNGKAAAAKKTDDTIERSNALSE